MKMTSAPHAMSVKTKAPTPDEEELEEEVEEAEENLADGGTNDLLEEVEPEESNDYYGENGGGVGDNGHDYYADDYQEMASNVTEVLEACTTNGPSDVQVISDEWSLVGTQPPNCTFPFIWRDKIYYGCADVDYGGRYWCANSCDFSEGAVFHRGECDIGGLGKGILGTGIALNVLNVFVALLMVITVLVSAALCTLELRKKKDFTKAVDGLDEDVSLNRPADMNGTDDK